MRAYELGEKIEKVHHAGGSISVHINPSTYVILDMIKKSNNKELRGLMDEDGTFYFWDAFGMVHRPMAAKLGIDFNNIQYDPRIGIKTTKGGDLTVSYERSIESLLKNNRYFSNTIFKIEEVLNESRDVFAVAVNQVIPTERGMVPNPNITDWFVKTVDGAIEVGTIHKNEEGKFELTSDFGNDMFDTIFEALEFVQTQYGNVRFN